MLNVEPVKHASVKNNIPTIEVELLVEEKDRPMGFRRLGSSQRVPT